MRRIYYLLILIICCQSLADLDSLEQLQKKAASMISGAGGAGRDLEAAEYLMGKFKMGQDGKPTWYPEFYPNENEMGPGNDFKPRISLLKRNSGTDVLLAPVLEVFQKKNPGVCEPISPLLSFNSNLGDPYCLEDAKRYTVDSTRLASLEESPQSGQYQSALVSVFNMDALTDLQKSQLMTDSTVSVQSILDSVSTSAEKQAFFDPRRVKFIKYNAHPENPLALGSVTTQVGGIQVAIPVALPPEPSCRLQLAEGQVDLGLQPRQVVSIEFYVNSIATYAEISPDDFVSTSEISLPNRQTGEAIGNYTKMGSFTLTVPSEPFPGTAANSEGSLSQWIIQGRVRGLNLSSAPVQCEPLRMTITRALPPACSLTANPMNILKGEPTRLNLRCQNQVHSAKIDGTQVSLNADGVGTLTYVRKSDEPVEVVLAEVIGPGGTTNPEVHLGKSCPFNDINYRAAIYTGVPNLFSRAEKLQTIRTSSLSLNFVSYDLPKYGVLFGFPGKKPCGTDNFCMRSFQATKKGKGVFIPVDNVKWYTFPEGLAYDVEVGPKMDAGCKIISTDSRSGGCFNPDTQIKMANGSLKLASDIHENDFVFNPHYGSGIRVRKVVKGPEKKSLYEIKTRDSKVEVTEDHPFLTGRGWVQAMELKTGDKLLGNGKPKVISKVKKLKYQGPQDVWNFEIDTEDAMAHVVIANGIPTGDLVTQLELKKTKAKLP